MTELGKPDQFDMRRLDSLSSTIFGVAMTLLAYDMPSRPDSSPDSSHPSLRCGPDHPAALSRIAEGGLLMAS
jgi:hypothetical protein